MSVNSKVTKPVRILDFLSRSLSGVTPSVTVRIVPMRQIAVTPTQEHFSVKIVNIFLIHSFVTDKPTVKTVQTNAMKIVRMTVTVTSLLPNTDRLLASLE